MVDFKKHVGRSKLGTRLVVVFREIPDDESYCLCVESDSLPDMYHDQLLHEVDSRDAQATTNLYEVLGRRSFGDGRQMLNALHNGKYLKKYSVSDVEMVPMPNRVVSLAIVNEQISTGQIAEEVAEKAGKTAEVVDNGAGVSVDTSEGLIKPVVVQPVAVGTAEDAAESKLLQARLMEEDAKKMREEAYALNPALKKGGRPKKEKAE